MNRKILLSGEELVLSPKRAIYWPAEKLLAIADLHIGKGAHFRKNGIPVPGQVQNADLQRLEELIEEFLPERLLIVGDMFHHAANSDTDVFKEWRFRFGGLKLQLVLGNHDVYQAHLADDIGVEVFANMLDIKPFRFVHDYEAECELYCISGHVHPGVQLAARAKQSLRLPCFVLNDKNLVLPAFSGFTGLDVSKANVAGNRYYAIGDNKIFEL